MYDPTIGQFISEDPIEFDAGDPNLRRYVGNSPTNYTDPTGLIENPFKGFLEGLQDAQQKLDAKIKEATEKIKNANAKTKEKLSKARDDLMT